jgi:Glycosyltransferase family 9 (heptosyltransferase)
MVKATSNRPSNVLKHKQLAARRAEFSERVLHYTLQQFILGDTRSRVVFLARALTWPARKLARTVRNSLRLPRNRQPNVPSRERATIAVVTGGGLGDVLSTSKYIERLYIAAGGPLIDVFYPYEAHLKFLFARVPYVSRLFPMSALDDLRQNYDAIVEVHRLVSYHLLNPDRLSRLCPELIWLRDISDRRNGEYSIHQREMPVLDGDLAKRAVLKGLNRKSLLGYSGAVDIVSDDWIFVSPDPDALLIFERSGLKPGHYVTLHDGFDTAHRFRSRSTKQWPVDCWHNFIAKLRLHHPELKIVQVGGSNSALFKGVHVNLVGNATFDEVAWLLKYAVCHVDSESGLVRLAREIGGKSIVLFGPTDPDFFSFAENLNLKPVRCGNCFWSTPDWLAACPKGLAEPECTASITPERVLAALETVIDERKQFRPCVAVARYSQHAGERPSMGSGCESSNLPRRNLANGVPTSSLRSAESKSKAWHESIVALMRDRIRRRPVKVALIARQECGGQIERLLTMLNGIHTTWFQLARPNEGEAAKTATLFSKLVEQKSRERGFGVSEMIKGAMDQTELRYGSALNIPIGRSTFDFVIFASPLNDKLQSGFALREVLRILKPGGTLIWAFDRDSEMPNQVLAIDMLGSEHLKDLLNDLDIVLQENVIELKTAAQAALVIELLPSA